MTRDAVLDFLSLTLRRLGGAAEMAVAPEMRLAELDGIDSLRLLEALALTELHFGVQVDTAALDSFTTVEDMLRAVLAAPPAA